jgi:electron transfer flavoprotein alpha subunit
MSSESSSGIWTVGEQRKGQIKPASFELITAGRKIADSLKEELSAIVIGHDLKQVANAFTDYGPDKVITVDAEETQFFIPEVYADALASLAVQRHPSAILFPATYDGRDVAARLAAKLGVGLAADCTDLLVDDKGRFVQVRPAFGGNLMAVIFQPSARPQLATLRPGMTKAVKNQLKQSTKVESVKPELTRKYDKTLLKTVRDVAEEAGNLDEAEVVIGVGRGIGSKENLRLVSQLASLLNAAIGGSRAIVDAGWLPHNQQIGLTGRAISPKMYIALGVSGAVQHLVGVRTAKQIVAINKDAEAPIFKVATLGIVGDLFAVLPVLMRELGAARPALKVEEIHT